MKGRRVLLAVLVAALLATLVALSVAGRRGAGYLDPEDTGRYGAAALVAVLRHHGVEVRVVRSVADLGAERLAAGTTVVVGDPTYLGPGAAALLAADTVGVDRLVLLSPHDQQLEAMGLPLDTTPAGTGRLTARCDSPVARRSDQVSGAEMRYVADSTRGTGSVRLCFPLPGRAADPSSPDAGGFAHGAGLAEVAGAPHHAPVVALGFASGLVNGRITELSQAGVALRALGDSPTLVWYQPGPADLAVGGDGRHTTDVWPEWIGPATALVLSAVLVLALVRGRRFGRLVPEPLPVVVRAVETTESRGRLYRRAGDRARAASVLRDATVRRLARRLALSPGDPPTQVAAGVTAATGLPLHEVGTALFGPEPSDDPELLRLAQQLADLEERARPR